MRASFNAWRDGAWWNELWATYVRGSTRAAGAITDFAPPAVVGAAARLTVLTGLIRQQQQPHRAPSRGLRWTRWTPSPLRDESFLLDRELAETQARYYYYSSGDYGSPYIANSLGWTWADSGRDEDAGWQGVERTFIKAVLSEGLYWLGLVDWALRAAGIARGRQGSGRLGAVRLTDMGRWLLMDGPEPAILRKPGGWCCNPTMSSPSTPSRTASWPGSTASPCASTERAVEFEIRDSVYRSQQAGQSVGAIKAWLEQVTGSPLPQNVGRSLDEWHGVRADRHLAGGDVAGGGRAGPGRDPPGRPPDCRGLHHQAGHTDRIARTPRARPSWARCSTQANCPNAPTTLRRRARAA